MNTLYGADGEKYISAFAGTVIDNLLSWVQSNSGYNLEELSERLAREITDRANAVSGLTKNVKECQQNVSDAVTAANEAVERTNTIETKLGTLQITQKIVATDGLYIGIKLNGEQLQQTKILPISFSGKPAAGKSMSYGIVDRAFVNDLKAYIKRAVNGELTEDEEPYRPKWEGVADELHRLDTRIDERITAANNDIKALEIYKDLFKGGQE